MTSSIISHLIIKDWRLHRTLILFSLAGGAAALVLAQLGGEVPLVIGSVWLFVAIIALGCMLPVLAIVNERKKQTLPFLMSLPLSSVQYTTAKLIAVLGMFIFPWLALFGSTLLLIYSRHILPYGAIPLVCILLLMPVIGFALITGAALVGETESWSIAATVLCNSSYGLAWYLLARNPGINTHMAGPVAIWDGIILRLLSGEVTAIVLLLVITYFLQARKRDFI